MMVRYINVRLLGYWSKNICDFSVQYIILKKAEKSFKKVRLALKSNLKYVPLIGDKKQGIDARSSSRIYYRRNKN